MGKVTPRTNFITEIIFYQIISRKQRFLKLIKCIYDSRLDKNSWTGQADFIGCIQILGMRVQN